MNKPLILVVEDDSSVKNLITTTLKAHDYRHLTAPNGKAAILEASSHNPDIVLLDLGLPDIDGVDVIKKIRTWSNMPIIVISARSEDTDKIDALDAGADDYLVKPFDLEELTARIYALARRNARHAQNDIHVGPLTINVPQRTVKRDGETITLTAKEFDLLFYLASNENIVLSRQQILDHVWEYDYESYSNLIDVYIKDLRKKIDTDENVKLIQTVRGVGYVLKTEN